MKYEVYRNLHKNCWSLRENDYGRRKVVGHHDCIILTNVEFKVGKAGRARVLKEKKKNVHAYVSGTLLLAVNGKTDAYSQAALYEITYNPYKHDEFVFVKPNEFQLRHFEKRSNVFVLFTPTDTVYVGIL